MVGGRGGDDRELVAAEPRHQIVAAHDMRQPQRDVADEFVADRMAERVVDVLEMVEVDVEHRHRRAAALDVGDHRLQPLAEEIPVRQAAQRVVQREIAQPVLAGGDGRRGGAHVAQHQAGEQRKARQRNADEGNNGIQDLGARPLRQPGKSRDRLVAAVGERVDVVAGRLGAAVDHPQVGELQAVADIGEHALVDGSDRQIRSGAGVAPASPTGIAVTTLSRSCDVEQEHRLGSAAVAHRRRAAEQTHDAIRHQRRAAAHEFDDGMGARGGGRDQSGVDDVLAGLRIDDLRRWYRPPATRSWSLRALSQARSRGCDHRRRLIDVVGADRSAGLHDALEPEQGPFAVIDDGPARAAVRVRGRRRRRVEPRSAPRRRCRGSRPRRRRQAARARRGVSDPIRPASISLARRARRGCYAQHSSAPRTAFVDHGNLCGNNCNWLADRLLVGIGARRRAAFHATALTNGKRLTEFSAA